MFWPRELHGLCSPWGCKELDTTEQLPLYKVLWPITITPLLYTLWWLLWYVSLARLQSPVIWSHTNLHVAVEICANEIKVLNQLTLGRVFYPEYYEWTWLNQLESLKSQTDVSPRYRRNFTCGQQLQLVQWVPAQQDRIFPSTLPVEVWQFWTCLARSHNHISQFLVVYTYYINYVMYYIAYVIYMTCIYIHI